MTHQSKSVRRCAECNGDVWGHHKYYFREDGRIQHRICPDPESYPPVTSNDPGRIDALLVQVAKLTRQRQLIRHFWREAVRAHKHDVAALRVALDEERSARIERNETLTKIISRIASDTDCPAGIALIDHVANLKAERDAALVQLNESPSALRLQVQFLESRLALSEVNGDTCRRQLATANQSAMELAQRLTSMTSERDALERASERYRAHNSELMNECSRLSMSVRDAIERCEPEASAPTWCRDYERSKLASELLPILRSAHKQERITYCTAHHAYTVRQAEMQYTGETSTVSWSCGWVMPCELHPIVAVDPATSMRTVLDTPCPECGVTAGQSCDTLAGYHHARLMASAALGPVGTHDPADDITPRAAVDYEIRADRDREHTGEASCPRCGCAYHYGRCQNDGCSDR